MPDDHVLTPPDRDDYVNAEPTKSFFVDMLVRDVPLVPAVVDLVDNAVDAARRLRGSGPYTGLQVTLTADASHFRVVDNCGGMGLSIARDYAFRFGRDPGRQPDRHSIGQFGVGMKRTLFKIGDRFTVDSATVSDSFRLSVDVTSWLNDPVWAFPLERFAELEQRSVDDTYTDICVTELLPDVSADMAHPTWLTDLAEELRNKHRQSIEAGLQMIVGDTPLVVEPITLLHSDTVAPEYVRHTYEGGTAPVEAVFVCGLGTPSSEDAGWYVFCNGRLVLGPDAGPSTGWGTRIPGAPKLPRWHPQYDRFRGVVSLNSDNPAALPWNTTKTDLDPDSRIWRDCLVRMTQMARRVVNYLNDYDRARFGVDEIDDEAARVPIAGALDQIAAASLASLATVTSGSPRAFTAPELELDVLPEAESRISYKRPVSEIDAAKQRLGVTTNVEVGNRTFDYFMAAEDV